MNKTYLRGQDLIDQIQNTPYSRDLIGYHGEVPKVAWRKSSPNSGTVCS